MTRVLTPQEANELIANLIEKKPKPIDYDSLCPFGDDPKTDVWHLAYGENFYGGELPEWVPRHDYTGDLNAAHEMEAWLLNHQHTIEEQREFYTHRLRAVVSGKYVHETSDERYHLNLFHASALDRCIAFIYAMTGEVVQIQKDGE